MFSCNDLSSQGFAVRVVHDVMNCEILICILASCQAKNIEKHNWNTDKPEDKYLIVTVA
jgi:hypothetical protein